MKPSYLVLSLALVSFLWIPAIHSQPGIPLSKSNSAVPEVDSVQAKRIPAAGIGDRVKDQLPSDSETLRIPPTPEPSPTSGLRREGGRGVEKGNS